MKRLLVSVLLVFLLVVVAACSPRSLYETLSKQAPAPAPSSSERSELSKDAGIVALPPIEERMIVRNGNVSLVVDEVASARDKVAEIATRLGGYVVSSSFVGEEQDFGGTITIRVPNDKFDNVMAELRALAARVVSESTTTKDVTEEYVDLQSRLRNAEATERQYLTLLGQAKDVDSTLKVYERLTQVRREIEQIKGRMQYLERTASMSVITVQLKSVATAKALVRGGWNVIEVLKSAVRGLVIAGQVIGTIAIWLIIFSPIWGTALGVVYWRRRKKKA